MNKPQLLYSIQYRNATSEEVWRADKKKREHKNMPSSGKQSPLVFTFMSVIKVKLTKPSIMNFASLHTVIINRLNILLECVKVGGCKKAQSAVGEAL